MLIRYPESVAPSGWSNEPSARATWRDVKQHLGQEEAAVEFVRFLSYRAVEADAFSTEAFYVALVVNADTMAAPSLVFLGRASELEREPLSDYRKRVAKVPTDGAGVRFYQALWKPLEAYLPRHGHVYISPDGILNEVSFGVVPSEGGQLLMDQYDLQMVFSTKDLLRVSRSSPESTAVLVGNPTFNLDAGRQKAQAEKLQSTPSAPVQVLTGVSPSLCGRVCRS